MNLRTRMAIRMGTMLAACGLFVGCGPGDGSRESGKARYPRLPGAAAEAQAAKENGADPAGPNGEALRGPIQFGGTGSPALSVIQSDLSPGTLWHSTARRVALFGGLASRGLGGPTYLAYSSPTGITSLRPGSSMAGDQMRENWLLAGFAGATNWNEWDSPWAVFLQKRPAHVTLETNGVVIDFDEAADHWTLMPLYGVYRPPAAGREVLKPQGLKEKGLLTWEWRVVLARDPLTRLRYWGGASRRFPIRAGGAIELDAKPGTVTLRERFEWLEIPDAWQTRPLRIAPISPALALVLTPGRSFPVTASKAPFDFEMPTVYGPFYGVPDVDDVAMSFRVLRYVNETESVRPPGKQDANLGADEQEALEILRRVGRELFSAGAAYRPEGGGALDSEEALEGYLWQARALPFFDEATQPLAMAGLRRAMWEGVLGSAWDPGRQPRAEGDGGAASAWVQAVWAVAHATGDREAVRERWPGLRREFMRHGVGTWAGFGRGEVEALGDGAAPAIAWARLAWLAGDIEAYRLGCGAVAREFALLDARLRGGKWFREQQPWQTLDPMPEAVALHKLSAGVGGWEVAGPGYPSDAKAWPGERWTRFWDWDVARFCRDHLLGEVRREAQWMANHGALSGEGPVVTLKEMGFEPAGATNRLTLHAPPVTEGSRSALLARCLAVMRAAGMDQRETLIEAVNLEGGEGDSSARRTGHLIQSLEVGEAGAPHWPRVRFVEWRTPTGTAWDVGEVRVGEEAMPAAVRSVKGTHGVRWEFDIER